MGLKHRIWAIAVLTALAICVAPRADAQFGRNKIQYKNLKWQVLTTPHFEFYFYQGSEAFVVRAALIMEDGYKMLSEKLQASLPWRVPVILYSAHNDFLQNNISDALIPEGVQAFAEPSRKRIVLPFTGSYESFSHTAIHELAHVFTFQIVYNRLLDSMFSQNYLFDMPLWIAEGVAEYLTTGWDPESDMFMRDAIVHDYLGDLDYLSGFMVYKAGQSALNYVEDTYGKEKVRELLFALGSTRSADVALERTLGLDIREFSARWKKALRKHYWPMYGEKAEAEDIGRRLTNHEKDRAYYNTKAVMSPDGGKIAYFSDRDGFMSIFIMSTVDDKILKKLVSGYRSSVFESLHFFSSSICFSPDGKSLAFVAKSKGRDVLYVVDAENGEVKKRLKPDCDELKSPTWSPKGDVICVTGNFGGQTDLILVDVNTGKTRRLTNDAADQLNPRFFPDGKRIAYTHFPETTGPVPLVMNAEAKRELNEMDFLAYGNVKQGLNLDIYEIDVATGASRPLIETPGDDDSPVVMDGGRKMVFVSDLTGVSNLYVADLEKGTYYRVTDVLGGIFTPDVNEAKNSLSFTAFVEGGYDVYISDDLDGLLKKRYSADEFLAGADTRRGKSGLSAFSTVQSGAGPDIPLAAVLEKARANPKDADRQTGKDADETLSVTQPVFSVTAADSASIFDVQARLPEETAAAVERAGEPAPGGRDLPTGPGGPPKSGRPTEGIQRPVPSTEPVSKGASVAKYRLKLAPDFVGSGGLYFATGYGFGLANTIALSDILGDHRMVFSFNIQSDIADSDIFASYYYLKRRVNYGIGVFQYRNYLDSPMSSIGESFGSYRMFAERNYGLYGLVSVPFTTFDRLDFELEAFVSERQFFDQVADGSSDEIVYQQTEESTRRLFEPSVSYVHDASFYDLFGPVEGSRWMINLSRAVAFSDRDVSRSTLYLDYRKYKRLYYRNSIAFRVAFAGSEGKDPRTFFIGGPSTLRGYDYLAFDGSRMAVGTVEYRFPLVDALIVGWPGRWGLGNVGAKLFFDVGAAWNKNDISAFRTAGGFHFDDVLGDFGFGVHLYMAYFLLNFQLAWQTDMHEVYANHFTFFIGPGF